MDIAADRLLDERTQRGSSALFVAALKGHTECVRLLLTRKADASLRNDNGWNALHTAAFHGNQDSVLMLLSHGRHAGPEQVRELVWQKSKEGATAAHFAVAAGTCHTQNLSDVAASCCWLMSHLKAVLQGHHPLTQMDTYRRRQGP